MVDESCFDIEPPLALVTDLARCICPAIAENIVMVDNIKCLAQHHTHLGIRNVRWNSSIATLEKSVEYSTQSIELFVRSNFSLDAPLLVQRIARRCSA